MKELKYTIAIALSVLCVLLAPAGILVAVLLHTQKALIAGIIMVAAGVLLFGPISQFRYSAREGAQYDEFGRSKKKQFQKLSQAERDAIDLQKVADAERLVSSTALRKMTKKGSVKPEEDLDALVGLAPVKNRIAEMAARMEFDRKAAKDRKHKYSYTSASGHHAVFFGSPGTGKTTVAKILTGFLYKYGYIKENKYIETDGNFLKAGTSTALKTSLVIHQAYNGVLFIDEAYALMLGDEYGKDAIATLIKEMEDNRGRFVVVLAGYTNEMKGLLKANPGFESRIKEYIVFPDYNNAELKDIFVYMARGSGFVVASDALDALETRLIKERPLSSFGNARTVRNILDESIDKHALFCKQGKHSANEQYIITAMDVPLAPTSQI